MTLEEVLNSNKIESNFEEFCSFLFDQKINPIFRSFAYLPVNYNKVKDRIKLFQFNSNKFYFLIEFDKQPILLYDINVDNAQINEAYCLNRELFKNMLIFLSNNIDTLKIPIINKNSRLE